MNKKEVLTKIYATIGLSGIVFAIIIILGGGLCFWQFNLRHITFAKAKETIEIESRISRIKEIKKLNVLEVLECGLMEFPNKAELPEEYKKFHVDCRYCSAAEVYVNLETLSVVSSTNGTINVTLNAPECSDPHEWPKEKPQGDTIFLDYCEWIGNDFGGRKEYIESNLDKLKSKHFKKQVMTPERIKMAKDQVERVLRYMLSPIVVDRYNDITFTWRDDSNEQK